MPGPTTHKAIPGKAFRTFWRYGRPYAWAYVIGAGLAVAFVTIGLLVPLVVKRFIGMLSSGDLTTAALWRLFWILVAIAVCAGVTRFIQRMLMIRASRKVEYDIRNDYFHHVQILSQDFFHRFKTGDIMARATSDLNHVRMFMGPGVMGSSTIFAQLTLTLALMVYFCLPLTGVALAPVPIVTGLVYFFVMYMHRQSKRVQEQFAVVTARAQENLAGARVVKAFGVADRELRDFKTDSETYMRESLKLAVVMALAWPTIGLAVGSIILLVTWYGGRLVIAGTLAFDDFSGFIVCLMMLLWPLAQLGWVMTLYQRAAVSMNRISEVFAEEPTIRDDDRTRTNITTLAGTVRFENVSFGYTAETTVLEDIDFEIAQGETVAIVGPTGSGKSSIVSLLTREYDPVRGCVFIDGVDACEVPLRVLRGAIGCVPQDTFLFSDSIRENLTFGRPGASEELIERAAEVAQFNKAIEGLPNGYDTLLGERGVNLSGGQKQRLAIARAVIRDPRILVLDDALSSVDTHTEEEILARLKQVMATRTSVIISHRVSTVRHADQILVLRDGRIIERGVHDDLVGLGGVYADMYQRQLLEDELEEEA
jgi:ATP-binding cassette, subfamily B, multidrug efflux pump